MDILVTYSIYECSVIILCVQVQYRNYWYAHNISIYKDKYFHFRKKKVFMKVYFGFSLRKCVHTLTGSCNHSECRGYRIVFYISFQMNMPCLFIYLQMYMQCLFIYLFPDGYDLTNSKYCGTFLRPQIRATKHQETFHHKNRIPRVAAMKLHSTFKTMWGACFWNKVRHEEICFQQ